MKFTKLSAAIMAVSAATALAACSSSDEVEKAGPATIEKRPSSEETSIASAEIPDAAALNAILAKATDPNVPVEEKTKTVQGSEQAPELFDVMAASQAESGAVFEVVDPVLPGYTPESALATVNFSTPDGQGQTADQVEFVFEDGDWKLSKNWACILVSNIVPPEQVPPMCADTAGGAGAPAEGAPAEGAPAEGEVPPAEAPAQ
ncbi:TPA: hypothetical protein I8V89_000320 [Corynebacterium striatum]|uniref:Low molecular weight antigen MTB12-like C-terminal domain-containing protein n=1 Tax=Corynebacterium striatum TaxID=43770 RepID=A0ABX7DG39_CORST|nr:MULTISPECIES: hypothetical protein [Corynebacterium]EGT5786712.1 hypothetical protein [Corynebacterium striatum]KAA1265816.1 hypothetical protein D7S42_06915 [Corynebacterium striatum]MBD0856375.1 hypothetical protein [Corynebacterium striatum]MDK8788676.1 hypothetical protein [Corynebacterium striatum]MDK8824735.1 hypothetical protein [Corynebacterium striatum]